MNVSIIIPIYNVEFYVQRCLDSVAKQTMSDGVECILVDDCGTDRSIFLVEEYVKKYSGNILFTILHHPENRGLSAARNTGIIAAKGEYLLFLDSDDEITPDCIIKLYSLAKEYDSDMVQGCYIADAKMLCDFWKTVPEYSDDKSYIMRTMLNYDIFPIMAQNRLVKRKIIIDNNLYFKEGIIHEDNHWTFFLSKKINKLSVCCNSTYCYRTTPGSIMNNRNYDKEVYSYSVIVNDFCNNIDNFEKGAQKKFIFSLLFLMVKNEYYETTKEKNALIKIFKEQCSKKEKVIVNLIFFVLNKVDFIQFRMVNLLFRVFMRKRCNILSKIKNKFFVYWNPFFRRFFLIPLLRFRLKNRDVSILANNCVGGCILNTLGLRFNSPFVNLWLFPSDFIKYCGNICHYMNYELIFVDSDYVYNRYGIRVNYPVALLDDITIFFMHYSSEYEAKKKWVERTKRINLNNIRLILTERDGCTDKDLIAFSNLPYKKVALVHRPKPEISFTYHIPGFEDLGYVGNTMEFVPNCFWGEMYYDYFDYVSFINNSI